MTSEPRRVFVWTWLPGAAEPVVAGRLDPVGPLVTFTYGRSYLEREDAIPLYLPELPLERGQISPLVGEIPGCIADAGPDAWGQRVILNRLTGRADAETTELGPLTYLLESGSDRIGALDFQASPEKYVPRAMDHADLDELAESAERVENGIPLSPELDHALLHGSSVGGARPKALLGDGESRLIAKFSSTTDTFPVVKGEFLAMELARRAGIEAAPVRLASAHGRDALLVERFDRPGGGKRRVMVSALTMLGLDEMGARYGSYADLADLVRARFTEPKATLRELFARIVFNILCSNNDDHPRNHAAFWDGGSLALTPAYDICPQLRSGGEAAQIMAIGRDGWRMSQLAGCVERASTYLLTEAEAREIVDGQIETIEGQWDEVCDLAELAEAARAAFWKRQFLNPYALEGYQRAGP
ncbi:MAG TPA: HipA domain-containing protein [Solirubrobacterales bacterium]|jgi:serine/threonine-protein kinase HipA|nr:HipA domain-containing protein [Solirubrobacterales bacterium]